MATEIEATRLSSPRIFLLRMLVFLLLVGFAGLVLYRQIWTAFLANPGLNALIGGLLLLGIIYAFRQVIRLFREVKWVNALTGAKTAAVVKPPILLAPVAAILRDSGGQRAISTITLRAILDSVGMRLDEARDLSRYLTGLLVFLGLLGTFWGLIETVGSIGGVIRSMQTGADAAVMFDELKSGLSKPIDGMSIAFTSSLFGLAGSLILGFLDLQAGQAQNRFYNELEDNLARFTADPLVAAGASPAEIEAMLAQIAERDTRGGAQQATAMANLAEGIQGLVQHMRSEQQMIRDWVEAQAAQQREIRALLDRLAREKSL
ncbi:MAG: flagellar motor protein MotA [Methylobacteriaceae bacterium]|nr:flagellar motor protein MotA [Methylobacteriaceae bacterium]